MKKFLLLLTLLCVPVYASPTVETYRALQADMVKNVGEVEQVYVKANQQLMQSSEAWQKVIKGERSAAAKTLQAETDKRVKLERNPYVRFALKVQSLVRFIVIGTIVTYLLAVLCGFAATGSIPFRVSTFLVRLLPLGGLIRSFHRPVEVVAATPA